MNYPLISEYVQSIKLAEENFDKLSSLSPVLDADGTPVMSGGNFAAVFKMEDRQTGKFYAVKCFLRDQENRDESYKLIASELEYVSSTFLTPIKYLEKELFVDTTQSGETEFPVLLMDWIEGLTLDKYIRNHLDDTYRLSLIAYRFCGMGAWLLGQEFAHGDLKPDNIIVKADGQPVLIDYDGMFVPAMRGRKARETGSADYRHPLRTEEVFNASIDDFSIASIALSLKAISLNPHLLEEFGADDRLLFSAKDYRNISDSECMKTVTRLAHDRELSQLLGVFYIAYARNELDYVSFKLLNLEKPEYIPAVKPETDLSTKYTKEDFADAVEDEYGVKYSKDGVKLLRAPKTIGNYKIREGVQIICDGAFYWCSSLCEVVIPNSVTSIGNGAFSGCNVLHVISHNPMFSVVDDCLLIDNNSHRLISCYNCKEYVAIPSSVTSIGDWAFFQCSSLRELVLPDSLTSIGDSVFQKCDVLHIISHNPMFSVVDDCLVIDNINHRLISCYNCKKCVAIPDTVASIGNWAFFQCRSLRELILPDSVMSIGKGAFGCCTSLRAVVIPDSVMSIGYSAFQFCSSLSKVVIPNSVTSIGDSVFLWCSSLASIIVPKNQTQRFKELLKDAGCNLSLIKEQDE